MFATLAAFFRTQPGVLPTGADVPHRLFESAEACAGLDPHEAQELRRAACAALRVVR